jgi:hypothetical protein
MDKLADATRRLNFLGYKLKQLSADEDTPLLDICAELSRVNNSIMGITDQLLVANTIIAEIGGLPCRHPQ